jgi:hypothetical protein
MEIAAALIVTLVSACALNVGYLIEHSVASQLPPLSARRPLHSARLLLSQRRWLAGFATEVAGWLLYVAALSLAPLSLVQATAAGGIGILALMVSHYTRLPLSSVERVGVLVSISGLALLGVSLAGGHGEGSEGSYAAVGAWLAGSLAVTALALRLAPRMIGGGPAFGLATGILFAAGDVATKTAVAGGGHAFFVVALVACYAFGTAVLQAGFQRGNALVTAGIATLFTNALPIVAGMTIFHEPLPDGWLGAVRVGSFALVVAGAVSLARHQKGASAAARERQLELAAAADASAAH